MSMVVNLATGPRIEVDKAVHIIQLPFEGNGDPTPAELTAAAQCVGHPEPTDVIVFAGRPWHYVDGELRKHPEVHQKYPQTILTVSRRRGEQVVWWSEASFEIASIVAHSLCEHGDQSGQPVGPYPFTQDPIPTKEEDDRENDTVLHVARSSVPIRGAVTFDYKVSFTINGTNIDPHMHVA